MKSVLILICAILMLTACGTGGFAVNFKGKDTAFEKKTAVSVFRPDLREGQFKLANYDLDIKDNSVMGIYDPDKAGQMLISFTVKTNSDDFKDAVKPGEFSGDNIISAYAASGDGKTRVDFKTDGKINGKIIVTEVTVDTIKGTVDLRKDDSSISGPFEAKIISKHL